MRTLDKTAALQWYTHFTCSLVALETARFKCPGLEPMQLSYIFNCHNSWLSNHNVCVQNHYTYMTYIQAIPQCVCTKALLIIYGIYTDNSTSHNFYIQLTWNKYSKPNFYSTTNSDWTWCAKYWPVDWAPVIDSTTAARISSISFPPRIFPTAFKTPCHVQDGRDMYYVASYTA